MGYEERESNNTSISEQNMEKIRTKFIKKYVTAMSGSFVGGWGDLWVVGNKESDSVY